MAALKQLLQIVSRHAGMLIEWADQARDSERPSGWKKPLSRIPLHLASDGGRLSPNRWFHGHPAARHFLIEGSALIAKSEAMRRIVAGRAERIARSLRSHRMLCDEPEALPPIFVSMRDVMSVSQAEITAQLAEVLAPGGQAVTSATAHERALAAVLRAAIKAGSSLPERAVPTFWRACTGSSVAAGSHALLAIDRLDDFPTPEAGLARALLEDLAAKFPGRIIVTARNFDDGTRAPAFRPQRASVAPLACQTAQAFLRKHGGADGARVAEWLVEDENVRRAARKPGLLLRVAAWSARMPEGGDVHALLNWCEFWEKCPSTHWEPPNRIVGSVCHYGCRALPAPKAGLRPYEIPPGVDSGKCSGRERLIEQVAARVIPGSRQVLVGANRTDRKSICSEVSLRLVPHREDPGAFPDGVVFLDLNELIGTRSNWFFRWFFRAQSDGPLDTIWRELSRRLDITRERQENPRDAVGRALAAHVMLIVVEGAERIHPATDLHKMLSILGPGCAALIGTCDRRQATDGKLSRTGSVIAIDAADILLIDLSPGKRVGIGSFTTLAGGIAEEKLVSEPATPAHNGGIAVSYDVTGPSECCGVWIQGQQLNPLSEFGRKWTAITVAMRGDRKKGFPRNLKIEVKSKTYGWQHCYLADVGRHLTEEWQLFVFPSEKFQKTAAWDKDYNEFVVTFEHGVADRKQGTLYLADIRLIEK